MNIINGIAYANNNVEKLEIVKIKPLDDFMIIVTFNNSEEKLFDATILFEFPVYNIIKNDAVFKDAKIINGILTWCDGDVDISTDMLYKNSYKYEKLEIY